MSAFRKNVFYMTMAHFANYIVPLITFPFLARVLGVHNFGVIALGNAISFYGIVLIDWGFGILGAQMASSMNLNNEDGRGGLFWDILTAKIMILPLYIIVGAGYIIFAGRPGMVSVICIMSIASVANIFNFTWLLQGRQAIAELTTVTTIVRMISIPLIILAVRVEGDTDKAAAVLTWPAVAIAISSWYICKRRGFIPKFEISIQRSIVLLRESFSLFVANASANLYTTANLLVVGAVYGTAQTGIYSAADRIRSASQNLILPISGAAFPKSCSLMSSNKEEAFSFARKVLILQLLVTGSVSTFVLIFSKQIIYILLGSKYSESINILRVFAICPILVAVSDTIGMQVIIPLGYKEYFSKLRIWAGVLGLTVTVIAAFFVSFFYVSLSTVSAEVFILIMMARKTRESGFRIFRHGHRVDL